jgi:hypothetical protein
MNGGYSYLWMVKIFWFLGENGVYTWENEGYPIVSMVFLWGNGGINQRYPYLWMVYNVSF